MNPIASNTLQKANEQAIYNLYAYLTHKKLPKVNESLKSIVISLSDTIKDPNPVIWSNREIYRLNILKSVISSNMNIADSKLLDMTVSKNGLTAFSFVNPNGDISVVFKGTGSGEWIDNGEGLSGIPEENIYITYENNGDVLYHNIVKSDYATDQQVEALNWFNRIAAENNWSSQNNITVSGHSKGGNKAQFIAIHSDLVDSCYSFDGQGFSPEALTAFEQLYGDKYQERRHKIYSLSADNDYVNVLGKRLMPDSQIYYFASRAGFHFMEAILDNNGHLRTQCEQGKLSAYMETISGELMSMSPRIRQYATLGVMNVFQKYLGGGIPVNNDAVSLEKTIAGLGITISTLLYHLRRK